MKPCNIIFNVDFLSQPCAPVESTSEANKIIQKLWATLKRYGGLGLAANQIGIQKRVLVAYAPGPHALVNPVLTFASEAKEAMVEGCLSLPGKRVSVMRPVLIQVTCDNYREPLTFEINKPIQFNGKVMQVRTWASHIVGHELDHLDGKLITDYESVPTEVA